MYPYVEQNRYSRTCFQDLADLSKGLHGVPAEEALPALAEARRAETERRAQEILLAKTAGLFSAIEEDSVPSQSRIRQLITNGGLSPDLTHPTSGETPLDFAVLRHRTTSARTLLSLNADVCACRADMAV